jgi:cell wall assembly regulator SMI1
MKVIWNRIETWLGSNAQEVLRALNPPATRSQIAEAEAALGISFPQDVQDTFLIHNGQASDTPWLLDGWEFLSLERIVEEWKKWKELLDGGDFKGTNSDSVGFTVTDWWNPRWIPMTYDGSGNHHCLDLSPGPHGKAGQIIRMWHDDAARDLVAPSYREWLTGLANDFEAGRYEMSDEYGGIVERDS